jgi:predicted lipid-binding transport protein (Tim44 family)
MSVLSSTPLSATATSTSSSSSSGTSTSAAASSTSSAAPVLVHHTNIGAIVGGIIGGVFLFLVLLIMLLWRRKNRPTSTSFFQYSVPVRQLDPTEAFRAAKSQEERERMYELPYDGSQPSSPRSASGMPSRKPSVSSALVLQSPRGQAQAITKQPSFTSTTVNTVNPSNNALGGGTVTDRDAVLQMLAQEVASVLQPAHRPTEPAPKLAPNRARVVESGNGNNLNREETPAPPPNYRAALGGQSPSW